MLQRFLLTNYHSHTRRNVFLSNGLSQSVWEWDENGMLEEGKESSIYRWILKDWFTNLLLQIQLRLAYQHSLLISIKVGSPTFSSKGLCCRFLCSQRKWHVTCILLPFPKITCHFDWCCRFLCSQRKWHVVCILLSFSETTRRFSAANAECCWCLVGPLSICNAK